MRNSVITISISLSLFFSLLIIPANTAGAESINEYLDTAYQLIYQGKYNEALAILEQGYNKNPGQMAFVFAMAETYHNLQEYQTAIGNYINIFNAIESTGDKAPKELHENLVRAYNSLGQKHHFTDELCLRIIYHTEIFLNESPELVNDKEYMEFLRKTIGHYDMAKIGAKMMETGGDGKDFYLYDDGISNDIKISFKSKAENRLSEFNLKARAALYQIVESDKTVNEVIKVIQRKLDSLESVHFKLTNGGNQTLEEIFYRKPGFFKAIQNDAVTIVKDGDYFVLDPNQERILNQSNLDINTIPILHRIGLDNLYQVQQDYNLKVNKLANVPNYLDELYTFDVEPNLYLISGSLKDPNGGPYPPRPKVEIIIDLNLELVVALRDYWIGILGSGNEYELAKDELVVGVKKYSGKYLPTRGKTIGHVREYANMTMDWNIEELELDLNIADDEFHVNE
ncbi:MAG: hypothetical protein KAR05_08605 [Candidatus Omnitrophica bacterium]|nr:hypothetical protein [Candidatus Omnitrophota bacterium]